jgi:periplasmic divalent cation tolerance protein
MGVQTLSAAGAESEFLLVLTTCGQAEAARRLAARLVDERLAACVNIIAGVESVYRWQGEIERSPEVLLVIKTGRGCVDAVEQTIRAGSDYELPEILAVPVAGGSGDYLNWLSAALVTSGN